VTSSVTIAVIVAAVLASCGNGTTSPAAGSPPSETTSVVTTPPTQAPTTPTSTTATTGTHPEPRQHTTAPSTQTPRSATTAAPHHPASDRKQDVVLNTLPGSKNASCVRINDQRDVRSGQIAMGNFAGALAAYRESKGAYDAPPLNFYVIPESLSAGKVTVTMTPVTADSTARTMTSSQVESAGRWKYFPVSVTVPAPGTWRFTAVSGQQRGCFQVTFTA
jgi:hypothetical protein